MLLTCCLVLLFLAAALGDDAPVVETTAGAVRGFFGTSRSGRRYLSYTGIPFAQPPVGPLRFKPPEEPEPWTGVWNATSDGPWCSQFFMYAPKPEVRGQEDCLYLSVFTHDINGSAPVMAHIHGGGYTWGDKSLHGPQFLMDEDIVVVGINYRVGPLGFLSFEDKELPGNLGLKDQVMALRWIQNNIAKFGGDQNKVTILGESAGASSVYYHTISLLSRGLFHGAIAESGTSYNTWALCPPGLARSRAQKLASLLSCPNGSSEEAVACLMTKDAGHIVGLTPSFWEWQVDPVIVYPPVLEPPDPAAFLTGPVNSWQHSPVPLLMGLTSAEGTLRTGIFLAVNLDYKSYSENFDKVAPVSLMFSDIASKPEEVTRKIRQFYFSDREITEKDWINITNMYSDSWFTMGAMEGADKHSGDVYFYYFDYLGEGTFAPRNKSLVLGAGHVDEILYIWKTKYFPNEIKGEDEDFSKKMVKIWTGFAKDGMAVAPDRKKWERWTPNQHKYMHITNSGFTPKEGLLEDRYRFWKNLGYKDKYE